MIYFDNIDYKRNSSCLIIFTWIFTYKKGNAGNQVLRSGGESNFGQFNPKNTSGNTNPTHAGYNQNLSYRNINPSRRSYSGTNPKPSGMYNEGFQHRPREGFFFDER